jgi:hypothetical protein
MIGFVNNCVNTPARAAGHEGRRRLLDEALAGWSERDRTELARLNRRFSDSMLTLMESVGPGPDQVGPAP